MVSALRVESKLVTFPLTMLEVRRYQANDYDLVWTLHRVALQQVGAYLGDGPWNDDLRDIENHYLRNLGEFLVGQFQGQIVAMGAFRRTDSHRAEIKRMRVHPDFQRRGIGQLLYSALEARARTLGYTVLYLDTSVHQLAAQKFYQKNGFTESGQVVLYGLDSILYEKNLIV